MISIFLVTVILAIELFHITQLRSFIGFYFEYLPISSLTFCGFLFTRFGTGRNIAKSSVQAEILQKTQEVEFIKPSVQPEI